MGGLVEVEKFVRVESSSATLGAKTTGLFNVAQGLRRVFICDVKSAVLVSRMPLQIMRADGFASALIGPIEEDPGRRILGGDVDGGVGGHARTLFSRCREPVCASSGRQAGRHRG